MKNIALTLALAVALLTLPLTAQDAKLIGRERRAAMQRMQDDIDAAMKRGKLSSAEKSTMEAAKKTLHDDVEARKAGKEPNRDATREALKTIRNLARSGHLNADDSKRLEDGVAQLRAGHGMKE